MADSESRRAIEQVARQSYGRLIALLTRQSRDVAAAEDALADAFARALSTWPRAGLPASPEAWLLTAARRRLLDRARHAKVVEAGALGLLALTEEAEDTLQAARPLPDWRLELMFVAAHPAIDPNIRTALMLQTVLGLDAATIASAFLVSPTAMGQRLSRAKAKIRAAGIPFERPDPHDLPARLDAVLDAIYAAFGTGWEGAPRDVDRLGLAEEAIALARVVDDLLPDEPEVLGLLALMLHAHARRAARISATGAYVPLDRQDTRLWDGGLIGEAEALLTRAGRLGRMGRFQLEAAIQSVHAGRMVTGLTDWDALATLYAGLVAIAPTIGALTGQAVALSRAEGPEAGLAALDRLPADRVATYQPWWAARADLLARAGRVGESRAAYDRAAALATDPAVRVYLNDTARDLSGAGG